MITAVIHRRQSPDQNRNHIGQELDYEIFLLESLDVLGAEAVCALLDREIA